MRGSEAGPIQAGDDRTWRRIRRTGAAARVTSVIICSGWIATFFVGGGAQDWSAPPPWLMVGAPVVLIARSFWFGIYVNQTTIKVVSWFWTYRLDRNAVKRVLVRNYNGFLILWSGGTDLYSANVLMVGFELDNGMERAFPATAMKYSAGKAVAEELQLMLGLQVNVGERRFRRSHDREDPQTAAPPSDGGQVI